MKEVHGRVRVSFSGAIIYGVLAVALFACASADTSEKLTQDQFEIEKEYQRGPLTWWVRASRKEISIAEKLTLVLETRVSEGYEVNLPQFGEKLEQFGVHDYRAPLPTLIEDGVLKVEKRYVLEPFLSGEYTIPPMEVTFWKREGDDGTKHTVESEAITISVRSLLPEDGANSDIRDIVGPKDLPRHVSFFVFVIVGLVLVVAAILGWYLMKRRTSPRDTIPVLAPHELAYRRLEAIVSKDLVNKGELKTFYGEISYVLRCYIEDRFGLHAPEQTTEEFLYKLGHSSVLRGEHKTLLKKFLEHCDLVKFAEHQPTDGEIQSTFDACRGFIKDTAEVVQLSSTAGGSHHAA